MTPRLINTKAQIPPQGLKLYQQGQPPGYGFAAAILPNGRFCVVLAYQDESDHSQGIASRASRQTYRTWALADEAAAALAAQA